MILFQIYSQGLSLKPLKGETPRAVNVNAVALGDPLEAMKIESRNIQIHQ